MECDLWGEDLLREGGLEEGWESFLEGAESCEYWLAAARRRVGKEGACFARASLFARRVASRDFSHKDLGCFGVELRP